mgnify:CR=1 FL=1
MRIATWNVNSIRSRQEHLLRWLAAAQPDVLGLQETKVEDGRKAGIALTTLGFGEGNYNEALMEQIADVGDGAYSYVDNLMEGHKVLVSEMSSTLATIARDVKVQIEFNPALVQEYRQIGYENRQLRREDFHNDQVDAGDIGAGHTVTALYELTLTGARGAIDPLRYGAATTARARRCTCWAAWATTPTAPRCAPNWSAMASTTAPCSPTPKPPPGWPPSPWRPRARTASWSCPAPMPASRSTLRPCNPC